VRRIPKAGGRFVANVVTGRWMRRGGEETCRDSGWGGKARGRRFCRWGCCWLRRGCNFGVDMTCLTAMVCPVSGGIRLGTEPDDAEFVRDRARRFGRGARRVRNFLEPSNAFTSILVLVDIVTDVSATSASNCTLVLIERNDDEEVDVNDDDGKRGNSGIKLSELSSSCSGSVPESSLCTPFVRPILASFEAVLRVPAAASLLLRALAVAFAALMELEARIFRFMPVTSWFLAAARNPAFSSTHSATVFTRSRNSDESPLVKILRSGACSGLRVSGSE
jgi:hypothetical protein